MIIRGINGLDPYLDQSIFYSNLDRILEITLEKIPIPNPESVSEKFGLNLVPFSISKKRLLYLVLV